MQPNDYKSIDLYLQKELSPDELKTFHDRLQKDQAFAAELNLRQGMDSYLKAKASQPELEKKMASLGKKHFQTEAKVRSLPNTRWLVGIAAAAVVGLMLWLWNPFVSPDLYAQYAQHQPLSLSEKSDAASTAAEIEEAFNGGNYQQAFKLLAVYLEAEPADNQARLAYGIAALELNNTTTAESVFQTLAAGESVYKNAGQWYLSLSYLKKGAKEAALSSLGKIAPDDPDYGLKAKQLRQALE